MRKLLGLTIAGLLLLASPALADVEVDVHVTNIKTITVTEFLTVTKDVNLDVVVNSVPDSSAESDALVNQVIKGNTGCENCAEKSDTITGSANDNSGVISINQASGNMNNQASAVAIAVDTRVGGGTPPPNGTGTAFAHSQATADQRIGGKSSLKQNPDSSANGGSPNGGFKGNILDSRNELFRDTLITGSINNNSGVVHANQTVGTYDNQANVLALSLGLGVDGVALAEAHLGQENTNNQSHESKSLSDDPNIPGVNKTATIFDSINGNVGIVGVNQSSGNFGNQANVVSVASVNP